MIDNARLRLFGNIPSAASETLLTQHLNYAIKQVKDRITATIYTEQETAANITLEEAVFSKAMISLLPAMNTLYVEGIPALNENGAGVRYFGPEQIKYLLQQYDQRFEQAVSKLSVKRTWSLI